MNILVEELIDKWQKVFEANQQPSTLSDTCYIRSPMPGYREASREIIKDLNQIKQCLKTGQEPSTKS